MLTRMRMSMAQAHTAALAHCCVIIALTPLPPPHPQVKANFTSIRLSAMEEFVGRGDRRVAAVIRRAWELGASNDSWCVACGCRGL